MPMQQMTLVTIFLLWLKVAFQSPYMGQFMQDSCMDSHGCVVCSIAESSENEIIALSKNDTFPLVGTGNRIIAIYLLTHSQSYSSRTKQCVHHHDFLESKLPVYSFANSYREYMNRKYYEDADLRTSNWHIAQRWLSVIDELTEDSTCFREAFEEFEMETLLSRPMRSVVASREFFDDRLDLWSFLKRYSLSIGTTEDFSTLTEVDRMYNKILDNIMNVEYPSARRQYTRSECQQNSLRISVNVETRVTDVNEIKATVLQSAEYFGQQISFLRVIQNSDYCNDCPSETKVSVERMIRGAETDVATLTFDLLLDELCNCCIPVEFLEIRSN